MTEEGTGGHVVREGLVGALLSHRDREDILACCDRHHVRLVEDHSNSTKEELIRDLVGAATEEQLAKILRELTPAVRPDGSGTAWGPVQVQEAIIGPGLTGFNEAIDKVTRPRPVWVFMFFIALLSFHAPYLSHLSTLWLDSENQHEVVMEGMVHQMERKTATALKKAQAKLDAQYEQRVAELDREFQVARLDIYDGRAAAERPDDTVRRLLVEAVSNPESKDFARALSTLRGKRVFREHEDLRKQFAPLVTAALRQASGPASNTTPAQQQELVNLVFENEYHLISQQALFRIMTDLESSEVVRAALWGNLARVVKDVDPELLKRQILIGEDIPAQELLVQVNWLRCSWLVDPTATLERINNRVHGSYGTALVAHLVETLATQPQARGSLEERHDLFLGFIYCDHVDVAMNRNSATHFAEPSLLWRIGNEVEVPLSSQITNQGAFMSALIEAIEGSHGADRMALLKRFAYPLTTLSARRFRLTHPGVHPCYLQDGFEVKVSAGSLRRYGISVDDVQHAVVTEIARNGQWANVFALVKKADLRPVPRRIRLATAQLTFEGWSLGADRMFDDRVEHESRSAYREWETVNGEKHLAMFVAPEGGNIILMRQGDHRIAVAPVSHFKTRDQLYVRDRVSESTYQQLVEDAYAEAQ